MNEALISVQTLRLFEDVERFGSFAAAARERDIDSSMVSRQIAALERALGFVLFERSTRRLNLTEAGKAYLHRTRVLVNELEIARQESIDLVAAPKGILRVTASHAFAERWLFPRLATFHDKYPGIDFEFLFSDHNLSLSEDRVDLAIRLTPRPAGEMVMSKLMNTRYRVVASPAYLERVPTLVHPSDLSAHSCLRLSFAGYRSRWRFRKRKKTIEVPVSGRIVASSPLALYRAALEGLGPMLVADWMSDDDVEKGRLIDLFPTWEASASDFDGAAWLLYGSKSYMPQKTRLFMEYLKSCV